MDGFSLIITGFIMKLVLTGIAIFAGRVILMLMDRKSDFNFKEWIKNADDSAISNYLGFRILAVFLVMAIMLS